MHVYILFLLGIMNIFILNLDFKIYLYNAILEIQIKETWPLRNSLGLNI